MNYENSVLTITVGTEFFFAQIIVRTHAEYGKTIDLCILFHALNNSLSAFEKTNEEVAATLPISTGQFEIILAGSFMVLLEVYTLAMVKKLCNTGVKYAT